MTPRNEYSLGDWPSALQYARHAVSLSEREMGSGFVRLICQQAGAHLFLGDPVRAWDLYAHASETAEHHPLPRYYRGQGLLLIARLIDAFAQEHRRAEPVDPGEAETLEEILKVLVHGAMDDLTAAADRLDRWGLIPDSYQYRNFHLVPTLLGQGDAYLLARLPGPAGCRAPAAPSRRTTSSSASSSSPSAWSSPFTGSTACLRQETGGHRCVIDCTPRSRRQGPSSPRSGATFKHRCSRGRGSLPPCRLRRR